MPGLEGPIQIQLPFSMADIQQCKEKLGRYSEDPDKVSDGFQTPALAFNLSWKDIQFLWVNCCTPIEKERILTAIHREADETFAKKP
jgi:hypothetical protein